MAGIGDMSGDVFGNAMLQSDRIRLVAAFDHRDIFLDPDPDPAASYGERARLFGLARSSWQDYDRSLISPGGGVWSRLDKRIPVSPEVRAVLRLDAGVELASPPELIRAILQAPVTLLFAGGVGTFVRATDEPDREIDDRANAELRVTGSQVRARVVGEGANLAFTQRARIEYARRGGHINTDAIDNSGGVDISDREVNLKILLRPAVESGEMTLAERDELLTEVCDDVVAAVLHDSARQSMALSRAVAASPGRIGAVERLMVELEASGVLDRAVEALPTTDEMAARARAGAGLTRPELAVLLAGAKRGLTAALLASGVPDQPAMRAALVSYFPAALAARCDHLLDGHRLRRELVASVVANEVVDRMGVTFASRLAADTGRDPSEVAAAWWIGRDVVGAADWWRGARRRRRPRPAGGARPGGDGADGAGVADPGLPATGRRGRHPGRRGPGPPGGGGPGGGPAGIGTALRHRRRARLAEAMVDGGIEPDAAVRWACGASWRWRPTWPRWPGSPADRPRAWCGLWSRWRRPWGSTSWSSASATSPSTRAIGGPTTPSGGCSTTSPTSAASAPAGRWTAPPDVDEREATARFVATVAPRSAEISTLLRRIDADPTIRLDALLVATRAVRRAIG